VKLFLIAAVNSQLTLERELYEVTYVHICMVLLLGTGVLVLNFPPSESQLQRQKQKRHRHSTGPLIAPMELHSCSTACH